jgi:hypothetical protein
MSTFSKYWVTCAIAALAAAMGMGAPEPAHAQFGFGGININIGPGGYRNRYHRRQQRRGPREEASQNEDTGRSSKSEKADKVLASLGAPSSSDQSRVLKAISASPVLGVVGSTKDLQDIGKPTSKEDERDYTGALDRIVNRLAGEQDKRLTTPGDVTATGIEQSLLKAIKDAKLDTFERFVSESWTSERVRKLVLDRAYIDLDPLFSGNARGQVRMEAVDAVIQRAAQAIYRRVFETSELLAANRAANQFIQRLYQATAGRVDDRTRDIADTLVRRGSSATLARYDGFLSSDDNSYAYHYRAQRIVYDCLSENVERISKGESRVATAEEMELRIKKTSAGECEPWLANQFGALGPGSRVKTQPPVPMRVVWSASGPIDDPSMYTRPANKY